VALERLWAGWRGEYVADAARAGVDADDCVLCRVLAAGEADAEGHSIHRAETAAVFLNAYPYNNGHLLVSPYRHVADLGAGEGTLSQLLAQRAEKVIAIDLSPKMVEYAQKLAVGNGLRNLEFRVGDIEEPPIEDGSIDLAILSQALHHAENPQRAIDAAFRILRPGGRLIILDLLQHNFSEARELYADRWLGFSESQIHSMLEKSGFSGIETLIADKEETQPKFQTLLAIGCR